MHNKTKVLFLVNGLLTLPLGILALIAPAEFFSPFGITLDVEAQLVARGYAATLIGYGMIYLSLRSRSEAGLVKPLLLAAVVFNSIEAIIQAAAGAQGIVLPIIWGTVAIHGLLALFCGYSYITYKSEKG